MDALVTTLLIVLLFALLGSGLWIGLSLLGVAWIGMQIFTSRPVGDAMAVTSLYMQMWQRVRNLGRPGLCSAAISAVDCALWDLKAQLLNLPLVTLLGQIHDAAPIYGSGGFTSYSDQQLATQPPQRSHTCPVP